jgi:hypothetical protein
MTNFAATVETRKMSILIAEFCNSLFLRRSQSFRLQWPATQAIIRPEMLGI